jgi:hypothetical protein
MSKLALAPNEVTSQCVKGTLSLGIKGPECEATYSLPSSSEVKNAWSYISKHPMYLHGMQQDMVTFSALLLRNVNDYLTNVTCIQT